MTREEAIKILEEYLPKVRWNTCDNALTDAMELAIEALSQPERPKGRWGTVWHGEFIATLECSACGRRINVDYPVRERTIKRKYPYCHCGADMRGGEE